MKKKNVNKFLSDNKTNALPYLKKIKKQPSTKLRDSYKRRRVLAMEIELLKEKFNPNDFKRKPRMKE